jgi:dTDP-4-dehydrorhamnose 3,5-epimerase
MEFDEILKEVYLIRPKVFEDDRGFFFESFSEKVFLRETGLAQITFKQDNHSKSNKGVLRGLHYQIQQAQGKLVRVARGSVFDVAVDIRRDSPNFGKWVSAILSADNRNQLWIPPGFAHGFLTLEDNTEFLYKATDFYAPEFERSILYSDPEIGIEWPTDIEVVLSQKDKNGVFLKDAETY